MRLKVIDRELQDHLQLMQFKLAASEFRGVQRFQPDRGEQPRSTAPGGSQCDFAEAFADSRHVRPHHGLRTPAARQLRNPVLRPGTGAASELHQLRDDPEALGR